MLLPSYNYIILTQRPNRMLSFAQCHAPQQFAATITGPPSQRDPDIPLSETRFPSLSSCSPAAAKLYCRLLVRYDPLLKAQVRTYLSSSFEKFNTQTDVNEQIKEKFLAPLPRPSCLSCDSGPVGDHLSRDTNTNVLSLLDLDIKTFQESQGTAKPQKAQQLNKALCNALNSGQQFIVYPCRQNGEIEELRLESFNDGILRRNLHSFFQKWILKSDGTDKGEITVRVRKRRQNGLCVLVLKVVNKKPQYLYSCYTTRKVNKICSGDIVIDKQIEESNSIYLQGCSINHRSLYEFLLKNYEENQKAREMQTHCGFECTGKYNSNVPEIKMAEGESNNEMLFEYANAQLIDFRENMNGEAMRKQIQRVKKILNDERISSCYRQVAKSNREDKKPIFVFTFSCTHQRFQEVFREAGCSGEHSPITSRIRTIDNAITRGTPDANIYRDCTNLQQLVGHLQPELVFRNRSAALRAFILLHEKRARPQFLKTNQ